MFQQIADHRAPGWPDQGPPQQLHLDVRVDDLEIADQRVRASGAVPLGDRVVLEDEIYRVYADPAGPPFCLVQLDTTWTAEPPPSGDLDPLSGHRRAEYLDGDHTRDGEEPLKAPG